MSRKKVKKAKILKLALIAFFAYFSFSLVIMQVDISNRKETLDDSKKELQDQKYLNKEIESILDLGNSNEYIIRIAREKLGFVFPDERVFIDINGSK